MKSSNIGGQAVLEGIMMKIRHGMQWLSETGSADRGLRQRIQRYHPLAGCL